MTANPRSIKKKANFSSLMKSSYFFFLTWLRFCYSRSWNRKL